MLREEWKFEYRSDELAEAAQQKLRFHEERLAFWRQKKQEVMTTIRAEGARDRREDRRRIQQPEVARLAARRAGDGP